MEKYDFKSIEFKWQKHWEETGYGKAKDFDDKPKHYHLVEFPYPSGAGLHVGHCMGYGASDAYCRMKRLQGFNVMYPIGWDAFGLPTENYALKTGIHPTVATAQNIAIFKDQIKALGYAFDWSREVNTTNPDYYHWTQWIFLQFYKHSYLGTVPGQQRGQSPGLIKVADDDTTTPRLAFQKEMPINWCPSCKIGLANEEVIAGTCERCGAETEKRLQKQWLLRITAYADRLISDLDTVDYLEKIKTQQVNWIGRHTGINISYEIEGRKEKIVCFTTRPDTNFGATFVVIGPEHPLLANREILRIEDDTWQKIVEYKEETFKEKDVLRTAENRQKTGIFTGLYCINPLTNYKMPLYVADYVLGNVGTGAVVGVPGHDKRDFEFAKVFNLEIKRVVQKDKNDNGPIDTLEKVQEDEGTMVNSGFLDGLDIHNATERIMDYLEAEGYGKKVVNYKLRDWIFSRQHYWGEPIPIVHCEKCGVVPLPEDQLPLKLPEVENYQPTDTGESPLAVISEWVNTTCPKCSGPAKRETDTMPNWAGSSWYFLRYCDPHNNAQLAADDKLKYWMAVDLYNGGMEHTTLHLLYSRFWHKFLYDLGVVPGAEPYAKRIAHGIILGPDGQKMSKSRGNVIKPDDMIERFGADTLRAYIMFIGPYDQESAWSMASIQGVYRFLTRVWRNRALVEDRVSDPTELLVKVNQTIAGVTNDLENFQLNTVVSKLMELNNTIEKTGSISLESYRVFLQLLYPVAPHLASELWSQINPDQYIEESNWPVANENYLVAKEIEIVVQINGKVRDRFQVKPGTLDEELKQTALTLPRIKSLIDDQEVIKTIVVPGKLVNIVLRPLST